jgi:hypothetical protein
MPGQWPTRVVGKEASMKQPRHLLRPWRESMVLQQLVPAPFPSHILDMLSPRAFTLTSHSQDYYVHSWLRPLLPVLVSTMALSVCVQARPFLAVTFIEVPPTSIELLGCTSSILSPAPLFPHERSLPLCVTPGHFSFSLRLCFHATVRYSDQ